MGQTTQLSSFSWCDQIIQTRLGVALGTLSCHVFRLYRQTNILARDALENRRDTGS